MANRPTSTAPILADGPAARAEPAKEGADATQARVPSVSDSAIRIHVGLLVIVDQILDTVEQKQAA